MCCVEHRVLAVVGGKVPQKPPQVCTYGDVLAKFRHVHQVKDRAECPLLSTYRFLIHPVTHSPRPVVAAVEIHLGAVAGLLCRALFGEVVGDVVPATPFVVGVPVVFVVADDRATGLARPLDLGQGAEEALGEPVLVRGATGMVVLGHVPGHALGSVAEGDARVGQVEDAVLRDLDPLQIRLAGLVQGGKVMLIRARRTGEEQIQEGVVPLGGEVATFELPPEVDPSARFVGESHLDGCDACLATLALDRRFDDVVGVGSLFEHVLLFEVPRSEQLAAEFRPLPSGQCDGPSLPLVAAHIVLVPAVRVVCCFLAHNDYSPTTGNELGIVDFAHGAILRPTRPILSKGSSFRHRRE